MVLKSEILDSNLIVKARDEFLNMEVFSTLNEAKLLQNNGFYITILLDLTVH